MPDLRRPNVKFAHKTSKRDADEVASQETNIYKAIIALNNYRVILRLHFPGRMDVEPFFAVWLRRILDPTGAIPSIAELEKAFQTHVTNRATAAANGLPPATFKEVTALANQDQVAALAAQIQQTNNQLQNLRISG